MRDLSLLAAALCLLNAPLVRADGNTDLVQGTIGAGSGGGYTAPDGTAGAGLMARGSFKFLKNGGHLILSLDAVAALGIGVSSASWSLGPPPLIGYGDLRAAIGGKTNGNTGCGFFALGGGEGGYNHLGIDQARVNAFVESGLACNSILGSQLSLLVGPIAKVQDDFRQQSSAKVLAGGRAELVGPRASLALEGVASAANLSSGPMDAPNAIEQAGVSANGEITVWRGLALGASVAYDYYGYKSGPFTYRMDGVTGIGYLAWHFDRKPASSTSPAK